jgi:SAM-dependent methyltransferase
VIKLTRCLCVFASRKFRLITGWLLVIFLFTSLEVALNMNESCILCAGKLESPFQLENMPASAQGFSGTAEQALSDSLSMDVYDCPHCGLVQYTGPLVPYYKEVIRSTRLSPSMFAFRREQFQDLIERFDVQTIFELGAGSGEYLDVFKDLGRNTYGIEGSSNLVNMAQEAGHLVINGFLPETDLNNRFEIESCDLATSFNFIEHLPDPIASLRSLAGFLKPGGYALLEVPNFDMISKFGLFNEFIPDHRSYFTHSSFQQLLSLSGFEIVSVEPVWDEYIISVVARKRQKTDWRPYSQVQSSLKKQCKSFFYGTPKSQNAIWSAGHQSLATISNLGLSEMVSVIIDSSTTKQDSFAPASGLPIVSPDILIDGQIKTVLLAAAGFNKEIAQSIWDKYHSDVKIGYLNKGAVEIVTE